MLMIFAHTSNLDGDTVTVIIKNMFYFSDESRVRSAVWEEASCDKRITPPLVHTRNLQHTISQRSSEDSWCSGSEPELSSDEESDRSAASSTR